MGGVWVSGALLGAALWLGILGGEGGAEMSATFFGDDGQALAQVPAARPLGEASRTPLPPPATPPPAASALRRYLSPGRDSRAGRAPAAGYALHWSKELAEKPEAVLQARDRIAVAAAGAVALFDRSGERIATLRRGPGDVTIADASLYAPDPESLIAEYDLATGARRLALFGYFGTGFTRSVLYRRDSRIALHSFELDSMGTSRARGEVTVFEVLDLGQPIEQKRGIVSSGRALARVQSRTTPLLYALDGERPVVAVPGHLLRLDAELRVVSDATAEFEPLALSVDEVGRAHVWVRAGGKGRLWVITRDGARVQDVEVGAGGSYPPILGYDHRTYLLAEDRIVEIAADGARVREHEVGRGAAGAVVAPDGSLVASSGSQLVALDREGGRRVLYDFTGDRLATAPVLTADGELLVASARALHCLSSTGAPAPGGQR